MRTTTRRKRLAGALVAAAATAAVSLASPVASYAADTPSASSGADAAKPSQAQLKNLDKAIKKHHALGVSGASSQQVVALPAGTSAAEKNELSAEIPAGTDVTVKISQFTKDALDKTSKTLSARKWHADADKYDVGFSYDAKQDKLVVNTDAPASVTQSLLDANPGKIVINRARFELQQNRFSDYNPYSGGAAIVNITRGSWAGCTAGVAVKNVFTGARRMMTAGHCGNFGDVFLQRYEDGNSGPYFGTVDAVESSLDSELITGANYKGTIWTGGWNGSTTRMLVSGGNNPWGGLQVCVSGFASLNHCGHPVTNTNFTQAGYIEGGNGFTYDQGGTWQTWGWQWGKATEAGDSGAPIYYGDQYNLEATIVGTHSGRFHTGECGCWRMTGVKIGSTLSQWRLDLVKHWEN
ncbi:hypothetical protein ABZ517_33870 [Streptomyces scabiei]|uniref:hypothetical protein n=1 Tax=Streptomyces scabiei TaxID=1930 RepID=UPI00340855BD